MAVQGIQDRKFQYHLKCVLHMQVPISDNRYKTKMWQTSSYEYAC